MPENPGSIDKTLAEVIVYFNDKSSATYIILFSARHRFIIAICKMYAELAARFHRKDPVTIKVIFYRQLEPIGPFWWEEFDIYGNPIV